MVPSALRRRLSDVRWMCAAFGTCVIACLIPTEAAAQREEAGVPDPSAQTEEEGPNSTPLESQSLEPSEAPEPPRDVRDDAEEAPARTESREPIEAEERKDSSGQSDDKPEVVELDEADSGVRLDEQPLPQGSWPPEIHGFVSQGFIKSNRNNYLAQSERGSFEFNEVGLNFTKQLSDRLRVGMQLFMRDLGPIGNYKPQFDWFYLDYNFFDWLGIRAGRTKIPFGLYNELNDIDAARVPILLPQSVYPTENRDYLLAQSGAEVYGRIPLSVLGALEYRGYGGTIFLDASEGASTINNVDIPYLVGGRLMWETPLTGLRAGGTLQALSIDGEFVLTPEILQGYQDAGVLPPDSSNQIPFRIPAVLWVASLEYAIHNLLLAAEYSRWHLRLRSDQPEILPDTEVTSERFYVMGSYRVAPWFAPGAYYSLLVSDVDQREGRANRRHDIALTLRFDMTDHWLFKLEGHYMDGTAGLNSGLNSGTALADLPPTWGLLLAKTTAYF